MPTIDEQKLTPEISEKYTVENNTFLATPKDNPKDKIEIELGDSKTPDKMLPQQKIMRWDNECNVSIRLKDFDNFTVETEGEKIKLVKPEKEVHFYQIEEGEGASEFEIILNVKPKTNVMEFSVIDKDVSYFYQPELTQEEKDQGIVRPENVIGSYEIYASENKVNYVGGKEYKCGKVGHIFRPKIIDAAGTEVWGDLHIENGILSVTIPQDFLDKAVYPVRHAAGLTFGYESAGASYTNDVYDHRSCSLFTSPASAGTVDNIKVYLNWYGGTPGAFIKVGIYDSSRNLITNSALTADIHTAGDTTNWATATYVTKPSISASTDYLLALSGNNYTSRVYLASTGSTYYLKEPSAYDMPAVFNYDYTFAYKLSIYATYTAAASGPANLKSLNTNLKANIKSINTNLIANVKSLNTNV